MAALAVVSVTADCRRLLGARTGPPQTLEYITFIANALCFRGMTGIFQDGCKAWQ